MNDLASIEETSAGQTLTHNVVTEFFSAAYTSGVQKPAESLAQLAGLKVSHEQSPQLEGAMKFANVAGSAAGQIMDFVVLQRISNSAVSKLSGGARAAEVGLAADAGLGRHVSSAGVMGFTYGSLLTPVEEGKSQWTRLAQGGVDAATFMTLVGAMVRYGTSFSTDLVGRTQLNVMSGAAAGLVNTNLHAFSEGRVAGLKENVDGVAGWALGNVVFGEGARALGKGFKLAQDRYLPPDETIYLRPQGPAVLSPRRSTAEAPQLVERTGAPAAEPGLVAAVESGGVAKALPAERVTAVERTEAVPRVQAVEPAPKAEVADAPPKTDRGDAPPKAERVEAAERLERAVPTKLAPTETVSMRELAQSNDAADQALFEKLMDDYLPKFEKAFPLPGEIESRETYIAYLKDKQGTWDMVILRDKEKNIIGGIQYQIVHVPEGEGFTKAAWGEHIWLAQENRTFENFRGLVKIAETQISKNGGDLVFMEFNNPEKMTLQQILEDASAGLGPADREKVWGRTGIHVAVDSSGKIAEYGQPSMGGEPAVDFLSLGFIGLTPLTGRTILKSDYLKLAQSAHATIPDLNIAKDPTVQFYTEAVNAVPDKGFTFVPLNALARARAAGETARQNQMGVEIASAIAKGKPAEQVQSVMTGAIADHASTMNAQELSALYASLPMSVQLSIRRALELKLD